MMGAKHPAGVSTMMATGGARAARVGVRRVTDPVSRCRFQFGVRYG